MAGTSGFAERSGLSFSEQRTIEASGRQVVGDCRDELAGTGIPAAVFMLIRSLDRGQTLAA
jgi:hypothetical protein